MLVTLVLLPTDVSQPLSDSTARAINAANGSRSQKQYTYSAEHDYIHSIVTIFKCGSISNTTHSKSCTVSMFPVLPIGMPELAETQEV